MKAQKKNICITKTFYLHARVCEEVNVRVGICKKKLRIFRHRGGFRATDAYYYFRYRKSVTVCEYIVHEVFFFIVKMTQEKFVDDGSVAQTKLFNRSTWHDLSIDMNMHVYDAMFYIDMKRERNKRKFTCLTELFSFIYAENISQWCEICAYLIRLNKTSRICICVLCIRYTN